MFGHLQIDEFIHRIEGVPLSPRSERHLEACGRCRRKLQRIETTYDLSATDPSCRPEPDWPAFRAGVRDRLLARAVRREGLHQRWTGWFLRPTPAWTLGLFAAAGFFGAIYIGRPQEPAPPPPAVESIEDAQAVWSNASVFEEIAALGPEESERLRELLEYETRNLLRSDPEGK